MKTAAARKYVTNAQLLKHGYHINPRLLKRIKINGTWRKLTPKALKLARLA